LLPLQSADFLAGWVREWEEKKIQWGDKLPFPWGNKKMIPGFRQRVDVKGFIADIDSKNKKNPKIFPS
jgi:hypothetical protein